MSFGTIHEFQGSFWDRERKQNEDQQSKRYRALKKKKNFKKKKNLIDNL